MEEGKIRIDSDSDSEDQFVVENYVAIETQAVRGSLPGNSGIVASNLWVMVVAHIVQKSSSLVGVLDHLQAFDDLSHA